MRRIALILLSIPVLVTALVTAIAVGTSSDSPALGILIFLGFTVPAIFFVGIIASSVLVEMFTFVERGLRRLRLL